VALLHYYSYCTGSAQTNTYQKAKPHFFVTIANHILKLLPIKVKHEWVKGHYKGPDRATQHDINNLADEVAKDYNHQRSRSVLLDIHKLLSPCEEVALQFQEVVITSNLRKVIEENVHMAPLKGKIMKDTGWSESTFLKVDWDAHEKAIMKKSRFERMSIVKLAHGLYQTNERNNKYYYTTAMCQICGDRTETFSHVMTCKEPSIVEFRNMQLETLKESLEKIKTPELVINTLIYGIEDWSDQEGGEERKAHAPSAGSVKPAEILLTQAFVEQRDSIGWEQMLRGRISRKWRAAYHAFKATRASPETDQLKWGSNLITLLWDYTRSLWKHRNGTVYGHTVEDTRVKERQKLQEEVAVEYAEYTKDNFLISQNFRYLFTKKSLEEWQAMDCDGIMCWLRTVKEAKKEQQMFRERLSKVAARFFVPRRSISRSTGDQKWVSKTCTIGKGSGQQISTEVTLGEDTKSQSFESDPLSPVPPDSPWPP
jgi:hypothetical protein